MRGNDFDGMAYEFCIEEGAKAFTASFYFEMFKSVSKIIGNSFFKTYYPDLKISFDSPSKDVTWSMIYSFTLTLDLSSLGDTSAKSSAVKKITKSLALMKSNFFAAPYRVVMD